MSVTNSHLLLLPCQDWLILKKKENTLLFRAVVKKTVFHTFN